jgi:hypothetical protein
MASNLSNYDCQIKDLAWLDEIALRAGRNLQNEGNASGIGKDCHLAIFFAR